jgi:EF hand
MKTSIKTMLALLALSASALAVNAQDTSTNPPDGGYHDHQGGPGGPGGMNGHRPPPSPLMEALDANHDGVIDADEIANASAALKKLDKNGDGKLTQDELRPHRPQGGGYGGGRPPGGPDGEPPQHPPTDN